MDNNKKEWVFEKLVKDDRDARGLLAYALYKYRKHELAVSLRKKGKDEDYISERVSNFHDDQISSNQLKTYREKADVFLGSMVDQVVSDCKKEEKQALIKAEKELLGNIKKYSDYKRPSWAVAGLWLLSGIPTALSGLFVTAVVYACLFFFVPDQMKAEFASKAFQGMFGVPVEAEETP